MPKKKKIVKVVKKKEVTKPRAEETEISTKMSGDISVDGNVTE